MVDKYCRTKHATCNTNVKDVATINTYMYSQSQLCILEYHLEEVQLEIDLFEYLISGLIELKQALLLDFIK
jgi:hypothetical protein